MMIITKASSSSSPSWSPPIHFPQQWFLPCWKPYDVFQISYDQFYILSTSSRPAWLGVFYLLRQPISSLCLSPLLFSSLTILLSCPTGTKLLLTSGSLHMLCPLPGLPLLFSWLTPHLLGLSSNVKTLPDLFPAITQAYNRVPGPM